MLADADASDVKLTSPIIANEKTYHLNRSKSKYVTVGLAYDTGFQPCITFSGNKTKPLVLREEEWQELLQYQGVLTNYFYTRDACASLATSAITVSFESYNEVKYIKLEDKRNNYICLGVESICQLWTLLPLIDYRITMLRRQDFQNYFYSKVNNISNKNGDVCQQIINSLAYANNPGSENISTMMELIYQHPNLTEFSNKSNFQYYC